MKLNKIVLMMSVTFPAMMLSACGSDDKDNTPDNSIPAIPIEPAEPVDPDNSSPIIPIEPAEPIEPDDSIPVVPIEPAEPVEPDDSIPVVPIEPAEPVEPDDSIPVVPIEPAEPVEPVEPVEPELVLKDIANNWEELVSFAGNAVAGENIGLSFDGEFIAANGAKLTLAKGVSLFGVNADNLVDVEAPAVISGEVCVEMRESEVHNLKFVNAIPSCEESTTRHTLFTVRTDYSADEEQTSRALLSRITIDGEGLESGGNSAETHWVYIRGAIDIEYSSFINKPGEKGAMITYQSNHEENYPSHINNNLFKNLGNYADVDASKPWNSFENHSIKIGSSSSSMGFNTNVIIKDNLFENVQATRRNIYVRASNNLVENNTFRSSFGYIAIDGGHSNTVDSNVILSQGLGDSDDEIWFKDAGKYEAGIRIVSDNQTVNNNYIHNTIRNKTGSENGAISILDKGSADANVDAPSMMTNNTIIASKQAFLVGKSGSCNGLSVINFANNFVDNGTDGRVTGNGIEDQCALNEASTFADNYFATEKQSNSGNLDTVEGIEWNERGHADVTETEQGLFLPTLEGPQDGKGASDLTVITADMVGPQAYKAPEA